MKIVIGSESFAPNLSGVAVFAERMARYLSSQGHEVYVFAPSKTFKTHYDKKYSDYRVYRLRSIQNPFRGGFHVAFLPASDIREEIKKIKPDLIHLQDPTSICGSLLKVGQRLGIPVVTTNHFSIEFIISYIKYLKPLYPVVLPIVSWYISRFYDRCTLLTTPSPTARQKIIKLGTKTEIVVISNGIDTERFKPASNKAELKKHFGLPDLPIVLYLGRIDKDKSLDVLINAIPEVLRKAKAHFVLAGGGDQIEKLKELVNNLGIEKSVTFLGRIEHESEDLTKIYQAASIFAMPSCIETQSIVTLEALASGLPLVAANATSMPEFVDGGRDGALFEPGNSKMMADKIVEILQDENSQKEMGQHSREYALRHSIDKTYHKFERLYNLIINNAAGHNSQELAREFLEGEKNIE